jgi:hypothetical protein
MPYLDRALQLHPGDLLSLGNLAHCYLFNNNYQRAIEIYKAHLQEKVDENFTWREMIRQDFIFFKRNGADTTPMNKALAELGVSKPAGY